MPKKQSPLTTSAEWSLKLIDEYFLEIEKIAKTYKLDTYPHQLEIISAEQMLDAYASIGMPIGYSHWSFGKRFIHDEQQYKRGQMGLAYEIVINSNPCIAYLMEENSMMMQILVMAHACFGHNSFFKGNYLFKTWSDAEAIIDYLVFAKKFVNDCEEKHGIDEVEQILDSCHSLMNYGVDRYKRPVLSWRDEKQLQKERAEHQQSSVNELWRTIPEELLKKRTKINESKFPQEPQENILYFIEKNAPLLKPWQREIVRIVRKIAQYFYPQKQTQVMNEGWACFWHYTLVNDLFDKGLINDGFILEFLTSHTNVVLQPDFDSPYYSGINPYALGYNMMMDIKRICQEPTEEDKQWFPDIAGSDWKKTLDFAMRNFKDESFIAQYLSPNLIRKFRFFSVLDDSEVDTLSISAIHEEQGYKAIREKLSNQYNLSLNEPNIQVTNVDLKGDRSLTLTYVPHQSIPLADSRHEVVKHLHRLWGFDVRIEQEIENEMEVIAACPEINLELDKG